MGQIKWYKRDPDAALNGMMELNLEERGAYNTVLDLIYTRDGNLADDDRFIAGWLRVDVRVWKRIKNRLIDLGKLRAEEGMLRNSRADVEVLNALSRVGSARDAGLASARSKAVKSSAGKKKNKHLASTDVETGASTGVSTNHNHNQKEEKEAKASSSSSARQNFGSAIEVDEVFRAWNRIAAECPCPPAVKLTPARQKAIKARLVEYDCQTITAAIRTIPSSTFLTGGGERGWIADIDSVLRPENMTRLIEGFYHTERKANGTAQPPRHDDRDGFAGALEDRIRARRAAGAAGPPE